MSIEVRHDSFGSLNAYQQAAQGGGGGGSGGGSGGGGAYYHVGDGGGGGDSGDAGRIERAQMATFHAAADSMQQENRQNFQMRFQEQGASLEAQLSQTRLNQAEQAHYTRLQRQSSYLDENGPNGTGRFTADEVRDMQGQINTGIDPLRRRLEASQAITQSLQQQALTQQVAQGAAARSLNDQIAAGNFQNVVRQVPDPNRPGQFSGTYVFDGQHHTFIPSNPQQRIAAEGAERTLYGGNTQGEIEAQVRQQLAQNVNSSRPQIGEGGGVNMGVGLGGAAPATPETLERFMAPAAIRRQINDEVAFRAQQNTRPRTPFNVTANMHDIRRSVDEELRQYTAMRGPRAASESPEEYAARINRPAPRWLRRPGEIQASGVMNSDEQEVAVDREVNRRLQQAHQSHQGLTGQDVRSPLFSGNQNPGGAGGINAEVQTARDWLLNTGAPRNPIEGRAHAVPPEERAMQPHLSILSNPQTPAQLEIVRQAASDNYNGSGVSNRTAHHIEGLLSGSALTLMGTPTSVAPPSLQLSRLISPAVEQGRALTPQEMASYRGILSMYPHLRMEVARHMAKRGQ